ncbi:hypothetical protein [Marinifilum sp. N1E240]|nr:hypothetical protein [Marinifilum sp. N1E240]
MKLKMHFVNGKIGNVSGKIDAARSESTTFKVELTYLLVKSMI